jgi:hypothetical protein
MSTTPKHLPPLTLGLINSAKAYPRLLDHHARELAAYRDAWDETALLCDTALHILTRALTAHCPIPAGGTKVGDLVRVCWGAINEVCEAAIADPTRVDALCPFRGVRIGYEWHRSWVRVKGGAA